jgi:Zn-finger nucleic acid-binding protein
LSPAGIGFFPAGAAFPAGCYDVGVIVECPGCQNRYDLSGRPAGTRARCRCGTVFELPAPTAQAGILACPRCGGGVAATNHRCEYCKAELLVKACPRCFERMFHGSKHCSRCGCAVTEPAAANPDGSASQRRCPRCNDPLVARLVGDVLFDECPVCTGVFLDIAALERLLSERQQARAEAILGAYDRGGETALPSPPGPMYIKCPDCAVVMNRRMFARGAKVIVDTCKTHGTWFDAHELPRIVAFAMTGGIERGERADLADQREAARRAMAAAKLEQGQAIVQNTRSSDSWSDLFGLFADLLR